MDWLRTAAPFIVEVVVGAGAPPDGRAPDRSRNST
jgi:hypothetical protein